MHLLGQPLSDSLVIQIASWLCKGLVCERTSYISKYEGVAWEKVVIMNLRE